MIKPFAPVAELKKVARDEKVSFGMATLHLSFKGANLNCNIFFNHNGIRESTHENKLCIMVYVQNKKAAPSGVRSSNVSISSDALDRSASNACRREAINYSILVRVFQSPEN